jgi:hypothetical protein
LRTSSHDLEEAPGEKSRAGTNTEDAIGGFGFEHRAWFIIVLEAAASRSSEWPSGEQEMEMRAWRWLLWVAGLALVGAIFPVGGQAQKQGRVPPEVFAARTVYFEDRTGATAVGKKALEELKRWGRYRIVEKREDAELEILLSRDPVASAVRGFGAEGVTPRYIQREHLKSVYLTVIDLQSAEVLWGDRHDWGGALTGENSAGERLVKELEKEMKK